MSSTERAYGDPETRRRILLAAWEVIEDIGADIRISDVADRAGVSRQAVYLHFGDRANLLLALVEFMPESLGFQELLAHVFAAESGVEMLRRAVALHSTYAAKIDSVARVMEAAQYQDAAVKAAWRDRMDRSRAAHRAIIERIAVEGQLADGWTVHEAGDLLHTVSMQGPWRELTHELGWSPKQYADRMTRLFLDTFVTRSPDRRDKKRR